MTSAKKRVLVIEGATATGKSALAFALAKDLHGIIINADSIQLYQELRILNARPNDEEMQAVPHRLYGILSGDQPSSAALWRTWALKEIRDALDTQHLPIVVGGTGLYLKALYEGLSRIPTIPQSYKQALRDRLITGGLDPLYKELQAKDPEMAGHLKPQDQQRIVRALEVIDITGISLGEWQKTIETPPEDLEFIVVTLLPDRALLYKKAEDRFIKMLEQGALQEVEHLLGLGYPDTASVMKAVGVREIQAYLKKKITWDELITKGTQATRQYIKRQYTWFRHQVQDKQRKIVVEDFYDERTFHRVKKSLESSRLG